jgi:hypothetical protein
MLDVLFGGLRLLRWLKALHRGIGIKKYNFFLNCKILQFLVNKNLDLDQDPDSPKSLDPGPDSVNLDQQHQCKTHLLNI